MGELLSAIGKRVREWKGRSEQDWGMGLEESVNREDECVKESVSEGELE